MSEILQILHFGVRAFRMKSWASGRQTKYASWQAFKVQGVRRAGKNHSNLPVKVRAENEDSSSGFLDSLLKNNPFGEGGTIRLRVGGDAPASNTSGGIFGTRKGKQDPMTVFVAGSTGRLGIRIVRELAAAGFKVRAGVRSQERADEFDERLDLLCESIGDLDRKARSQIKVVYCDLQDEESIKPAIGNASRVICAVGAAESEFTNLAAPKQIDFEATETLIDVAASCDIPQFILVTSLGTGKIGFPAGVLNLFGGILIWKRKAEEALERSGMPYLIVRPGGMERPKDNHKYTHNVRLATRDTLFGGTVSRLQIAELITAAVISPESVTNKCVEVVAETEAPLQEYESLLGGMPVEVDQSFREQALVSLEELQAQEEDVRARIETASENLEETRVMIAELQSAAKEARAEQKGLLKENMEVLRNAERLETQVQSLREELESKKLLVKAAKAVAQEQQKGINSGTVLSAQEIDAIQEAILFPRVEEEENVVVAGSGKSQEGGKRKQGSPFDFANFLPGQAAAQEETPIVEDQEVEDTRQEPEESDSDKRESMLGGFVGFLGGDSRKVGVTPNKVAEKEEPVIVEEPVPQASSEKISTPTVEKEENAGIFGSLKNMFGGQEAVYIDEIEETDAQQVSETSAESDSQATAPVVVTEDPAPVPEKDTIEPKREPKREEKEDIPANVAEAREWIAAWKRRSGN